MTDKIEKAREALNRGGFHATARGHLEDAIFISEAIALLVAPVSGGEEPHCACGDSFTSGAKCVNCLHVENLAVEGGEEQAALDALDKFDKLSFENKKDECYIFGALIVRHKDTIRKALQARPEVVEVTVKQIIDECHLWGSWDNVVANGFINAIATRYHNGLKIVAEKEGQNVQKNNPRSS